MKISAVICTRNRADYLPQAIRSLAEQNIVRDDYEIIVVDNASTDATEEIVRRLIGETPNLRYVHESSAGLSAARNRGLNEAVAPIVAFLDDDALAANGWLAAILEAFKTEPRPACVGGPVEIWWEIPKPSWFPSSLLGCHNRRYGDHAHWYNFPAEHPIGCNMAFVKQCVEEVGGFNVLLEQYNDETELTQRIVQAGGGIFYQPAASVRHLVAKERLSFSWQMKRHYREGISLAIAATSKVPPARMRRIKEVRHDLLSIAKRCVRLIISRDPVTARVDRLAHLSMLVGKVVYLTKSLRQR
ncbi:MAG: glucosyl-dolichyl phosphate glucuronosyltransferase [Verrucomicrobiota bacterium]|jgi:glycosyltransferase involved in cell wall biosynthesis